MTKPRVGFLFEEVPRPEDDDNFSYDGSVIALVCCLFVLLAAVAIFWLVRRYT